MIDLQEAEQELHFAIPIGFTDSPFGPKVMTNSRSGRAGSDAFIMTERRIVFAIGFMNHQYCSKSILATVSPGRAML